jgi:curved DNA-binding protein CbpA
VASINKLAAIKTMIDYYKILGLNQNASQKDIKKAYRRKSLYYHPDKNNSADSHEKFIKINQAFEILGDPERRKKYDQLYNRYVLNQNSTFSQQEKKDWQGNLNNAASKGKEKGEKYAQDFNIFSKKVLKTAFFQILAEIGVSLIFGELADIGLFAGLVMPIAGIIILSNSPNTINLETKNYCE